MAIDHPPAAGAWPAAVGEQVRAILERAEEAGEALRREAEHDAARTRAELEREVAALVRRRDATRAELDRLRAVLEAVLEPGRSRLDG